MISKQKDGSLWLSVYIQPGASKTEIVGPHDNSLKIRVHAPPVEGKANLALTTFIAKMLNIPKSSVQVVHGDLQRKKTIRIEMPDLDYVKSTLGI